MKDVQSSDELAFGEGQDWESVAIYPVDLDLPRSSPYQEVPLDPLDGSFPKFSKSHGLSAFDSRESAKYLAKLREHSMQEHPASNAPRETYHACSPSYFVSESENEDPDDDGTDSSPHT